VLRDRNALYREAADQRIENTYTLKLVNKDVAPRSFRIHVDAPAGIELRGGPQTVDADAEQVLNLPLVLSAPSGVRGKQEVTFRVERADGAASTTVPSTFFGPM